MAVSQARIEQLLAGDPPRNQEEVDALAINKAQNDDIKKYGADVASSHKMDPQHPGKVVIPGIDDIPGGLQKPTVGYYGGHRGAAEQEEQRYEGLAAAADARRGPQMDLARYNAARAQELRGAGDQQAALDYMRGTIGGQGPSVAALQQRQGLAAANQQGAMQMANVRGGGAAMIAQQNAGIGYGGLGASGAVGAGGLARAQETAGVLGGYGTAANAMRGQGLQRASQSAQTGFQQAGLEAQQRAANDRRNNELENMRQGVFQDQMGAAQWAESASHGRVEADRALQEQRAAREAANDAKWVAGAASGAGAGASLVGDYYARQQAEEDKKRRGY